MLSQKLRDPYGKWVDRKITPIHYQTSPPLKKKKSKFHWANFTKEIKVLHSLIFTFKNLKLTVINSKFGYIRNITLFKRKSLLLWKNYTNLAALILLYARTRLLLTNVVVDFFSFDSNEKISKDSIPLTAKTAN